MRKPPVNAKLLNCVSKLCLASTIFLVLMYFCFFPIATALAETKSIAQEDSIERFVACSSAALPTMDGYELRNHEAFLDLPDPMVSRSTAALEETYVLELVQGRINGPLTKTFCQIGVTRMVVDIAYSVEDDSYSHISIRAIYNWVAGDELAGWQITELGEKFICARGRDQSTQLCL